MKVMKAFLFACVLAAASLSLEACIHQCKECQSPTAPEAPAPVIVSFGSAATICSGEKANLAWEVTADAASMGPDIGNIAIPRGNKLVAPTHDTVYTLTATNKDGQATSRDVEIKVNNCAASPSNTVPPHCTATGIKSRWTSSLSITQIIPESPG